MLLVRWDVRDARAAKQALAEPAPRGQDLSVSEAGLSHRVCYAQRTVSACRGRDLWREAGPGRDGEFDEGIRYTDHAGQLVEQRLRPLSLIHDQSETLII